MNHGAVDSPLLTDLAADVDASPQVQEGDELGNGAEKAAVTHRLSVLPEHVERNEVGEDACGAVIEATEDSVTPLARHFLDIFLMDNTVIRLINEGYSSCRVCMCV